MLEERDPLFFALLLPGVVAELIARVREPEKKKSSLTTSLSWWPGALIAATLLIAFLAWDLFAYGWRGVPEPAWLALIVAEIGALLVAPALVWQRLRDESGRIDDLLTDGDNKAVAGWLDGKLVPNGHLALCLLGTGIGVAGSLAASHHLSHPLSLPYYVAIGILGFLAVDVARWIWRSPMILLYISRRCEQLRINKLAPAETPSVCALSDLIASASLFAAIGLFLFAAPLVWMAIDSSSHNRMVIGVLSLAPMAIALTTTTYLTFLPQAWLTKILRDHQLQVLHGIAEDPFVDGPIRQPSQQLDDTIKLYQTFAAGSTKTPAAKATMRGTAKVALVIAPYVGTLLVKLLPLH